MTATPIARSSFHGIVTHSGREVSYEGGVPSLQDIALSLSRAPRFAGHTRVWWSVLDHSLFVERLAEVMSRHWEFGAVEARALRVAALLHDAHEALTADVPTPFKPFIMKDLQTEFDERIADAYMPGGWQTLRAFRSELHRLDRFALVAEATVIGPPLFDGPVNVERYFGQAARAEDLILLVDGMADGTLAYAPEGLSLGVNAPIVQAFISRWASLG